MSLARTLHRWAGALAELDRARRDKLARYADEIAATLARASASLVRLEADPKDRAAARDSLREFGRIAGYVETIISALQHHLDGRKLAGVKRRLERLVPPGGEPAPHAVAWRSQIDRLVATEGYFRALGDSLRA